jgi:hypothetical protein
MGSMARLKGRGVGLQGAGLAAGLTRGTTLGFTCRHFENGDPRIPGSPVGVRSNPRSNRWAHFGYSTPRNHTFKVLLSQPEGTTMQFQDSPFTGPVQFINDTGDHIYLRIDGLCTLLRHRNSHCG